MSYFPFVIEKLLVLQVHFRDIIPYSSYLRSVLFISRLHYNISRLKEHILPPGKEAFGVYNIKSAVPKDGKRLFDYGFRGRNNRICTQTISVTHGHLQVFINLEGVNKLICLASIFPRTGIGQCYFCFPGFERLQCDCFLSTCPCYRLIRF